MLTIGIETFRLEDLLWGLKKAKGELAVTQKALTAGERLVQSDFSERCALEFTESVCNWGRGERVFANLKRHNGSSLGKKLAEALEQAWGATDDNSAIAPLIDINGLRTSFASKHLRMLRPDRFGVLDSRYEEFFGFATNQAGYALFMAGLRKFAEEFKDIAPAEYQDLPIGAIESGLFFLVQPRSREEMARERAALSASGLK